MSPQRIQRKRTKGFRLPPNTVCVNRPTKWGNPFMVSDLISQHGIHEMEAIRLSLKHYRQWCRLSILNGKLNPQELRGKNLACFCPLSSPCHADILLKLANN